MDIKAPGFIFSLCLIRAVVSFTSKTINVTEFTCGQTFNINRNEKLFLSFYYQRFRNKDGYGFKSSRCILTVVNKNPYQSICIKNTKSDGTGLGLSACLAAFKYFIGYLPFHMLHGYTCSSFKSPLCTPRSTVYPTFSDDVKYERYPVNVEIYAQDTRVTTTPYSYASDDDDDVNDDNNTRPMTGIIVKATIGTLVLAVLLYVSYIYMNPKCRGNIAVPNSDEHCSQEPLPQSDDRTQGRLMCAPDAPQYGIRTEQERLRTGEADKQWKIHEPVYQVNEPPPDSAFPIPLNQPSCQDYIDRSHSSDIPDRRQLIPTAPPPDYANLPSPPAYPGY